MIFKYMMYSAKGAKMKIFISDLHLGDGSKTDDFHRDKELIRFLEYVHDTNADLCLLGDVFELWQADLDNILWHNHKIIKVLHECKVLHIYGNHDWLPYSRLEEEGLYGPIIWAEHGHQYDQFNRYNNPLFALKWPIGKYITLAIAELERWFHKDVDVWAEKMKDKFGKFLWEAANLNNKGKPDYYTNGMLRFETGDILEQRAQHILKYNDNVQIVIFGHSHQADLIRFKDGIYANCGSWTDQHTPTYVSVEDRVVELRNGITHDLLAREIL